MPLTVYFTPTVILWSKHFSDLYVKALCFKALFFLDNMHICFENQRPKDDCNFVLDQYFVGLFEDRQSQDCSGIIQTHEREIFSVLTFLLC